MHDIDKAVNFLLEHRFSRQCVKNIPASIYPKSPQAAYGVQSRVVSYLVDKYGSKTCGYKLACTNKMAMALLGMAGPFCGRLLAHSTYQDGVTLNAADFTHRLIESEFVFVMERDVPASAEPYDAGSIQPFIGRLAPGIEIVDHRYTDFTQVGGNALIADNAIHGASITGSSDIDWRTIDLSQHAVRLRVNGENWSEGKGENVLGGPLNALAWLANHLQNNGSRLQSGDIVTTGTVCEVYHARSGDKIEADFGLFGSVSLKFN